MPALLAKEVHCSEQLPRIQRCGLSLPTLKAAIHLARVTAPENAGVDNAPCGRVQLGSESHHADPGSAALKREAPIAPPEPLAGLARARTRPSLPYLTRRIMPNPTSVGGWRKRERLFGSGFGVTFGGGLQVSSEATSESTSDAASEPAPCVA